MTWLALLLVASTFGLGTGTTFAGQGSEQHTHVGVEAREAVECLEDVAQALAEIQDTVKALHANVEHMETNMTTVRAEVATLKRRQDEVTLP